MRSAQRADIVGEMKSVYLIEDLHSLRFLSEVTVNGSHHSSTSPQHCNSQLPTSAPLRHWTIFWEPKSARVPQQFSNFPKNTLEVWSKISSALRRLCGSVCWGRDPGVLGRVLYHRAPCSAKTASPSPSAPLLFSCTCSLSLSNK